MISEMECFSAEERLSIKRTNKPMMEKRRRARINQSLAQLKHILIEGKQNSPSHSKWEKADILEMTVTYVKKLLAERVGDKSSSQEFVPFPLNTTRNGNKLKIESSDDLHGSPVDTSCSVPSPSSSEGTSECNVPCKKAKLEPSVKCSMTSSLPSSVASSTNTGHTVAPFDVPACPLPVDPLLYRSNVFFSLQQQYNLLLARQLGSLPASLTSPLNPTLPTNMSASLPGNRSSFLPYSILNSNTTPFR